MGEETTTLIDHMQDFIENRLSSRISRQTKEILSDFYKTHVSSSTNDSTIDSYQLFVRFLTCLQNDLHLSSSNRETNVIDDQINEFKKRINDAIERCTCDIYEFSTDHPSEQRMESLSTIFRDIFGQIILLLEQYIVSSILFCSI